MFEAVAACLPPYRFALTLRTRIPKQAAPLFSVAADLLFCATYSNMRSGRTPISIESYIFLRLHGNRMVVVVDIPFPDDLRELFSTLFAAVGICSLNISLRS